jgi:hypothetical protein
LYNPARLGGLTPAYTCQRDVGSGMLNSSAVMG